MTREHKIALIIGFALVLVVGILISDHMSAAGRARVETDLAPEVRSDAPPMEALPSGDASSEPEPIRSIAARPRSDSSSSENGPIGRALPGADQSSPSGEASGDGDSGNAKKKEEAGSTRSRLTWLREQWENGVRPPPAAEMTSEDPSDREKQNAGRADSQVRLHPVRKGETLWRIAKGYYGDGSLAEHLAEFNEDRAPNPDALRAGVTLRIPPKSVLLGEGRPALRSLRAASESDEKPRAAREYTIEKGDTLGEIAQRFLGTVDRVDEIIELNKDVIDDPDHVPAGVTIKLPPR